MKHVCIWLLCAVIGFAPGLSSNGFIRWVDCKYSYEMLQAVYDACVARYGTATAFSFADMLGFLAYKNGNSFGVGDRKILAAALRGLDEGKSLETQGGGGKYYAYHRDCARAIFDGFVGLYTCDGKTKFGLTAYFPLAAGYWYNHYDDFGNSRSYGYKRRHLGHDIMGSVGTPVVAVEGGTVTECGWNRYGGWRVGVRSDDGLRYWYYAHLKKDKPYAAGVEVGARVSAGQTLGYLGRTGYSGTPNTNLKTGDPHLHIGLQLIFDPSQEKGAKEIWVDLYAITRFLSRLRASGAKNADGDYVTEHLRTRLDA